MTGRSSSSSSRRPRRIATSIVGQVGQEHAELVPAQACHQVAARAAPSDSRGPISLQELVAEVMAERVVDLLEVVEVHQHHGRRSLPSAPASAMAVGQLLLEQHAVGQAREGVVQRLVLVLGLALGELVRGDLQRVRPLEHLAGERERAR